MSGRTAKIKTAFRWLLALSTAGIGVMHFVDPGSFVGIMPPYVPWPLAMVYISGLFEILGGVGLVPERTRSPAGYGLIALYIAVFPANIHMALNNIQLAGQSVAPWALWARLPFQFVFIGLAYWVSRPEE